MSNEHLNSGRKAQKLQTRKKILKAANNLVKNNQALNMDAVAQEAGISRATIYRYYSNTEDIATELILQLNVPDAEKLNSGLKGTNLTDAMKSIQNAYLDFIFKNENPSKKFLGAVLSSSDTKLERGQNRITSISKFLDSDDIKISSDEKKKLSVIATLLMGIEAVLVTKDVCGLDNKESRETLNWAMERILEGYQE
ncbi:MAG: TetR family transcriptional regulator [Pseudozobellia sp.]|nr:TetR family transcriptional regulator [Pseudozobellia sp.]MBG47125.1 TetR family transcriptional regulator [Pseudozobellia sp.]|tara:strand:- start:101821 stop:102411 length:591 start_codon:yes stop_codon:yes gene_type:complete